MKNRIAVSLGLPDTAQTLATLHRLAPQIGLAELRLDLMQRYDLRQLTAESPVPLIVTCRAPREGGQFAGTEAERLAILVEAVALGCAYIDVEWDSVAAISQRGVPAERIIASRHWQEQMPADLLGVYQRLRPHAQVVKLVGLAQQPAAMLPVLQLLQAVATPVIGIAMGAAGQLTRLLAPHFAACFLTYGTADPALSTAAGQLSVAELHDVYRLQHVGPHTAITLHLCASQADVAAARALNANVTDGAALHLPLLIDAAQASALLPELRRLLPALAIAAAPELPAALAALADQP